MNMDVLIRDGGVIGVVGQGARSPLLSVSCPGAPG
jgi:hypothetical protein